LSGEATGESSARAARLPHTNSTAAANTRIRMNVVLT
jgi:hypothetical protein